MAQALGGRIVMVCHGILNIDPCFSWYCAGTVLELNDRLRLVLPSSLFIFFLFLFLPSVVPDGGASLPHFDILFFFYRSSLHTVWRCLSSSLDILFFFYRHSFPIAMSLFFTLILFSFSTVPRSLQRCLSSSSLPYFDIVPPFSTLTLFPSLVPDGGVSLLHFDIIFFFYSPLFPAAVPPFSTLTPFPSPTGTITCSRWRCLSSSL